MLIHMLTYVNGEIVGIRNKASRHIDFPYVGAINIKRPIYCGWVGG
jgi:hypothetical protein